MPRGDTAAGLFNADDWVPPKDQRKMDGFIVFALAAAAQAVEDAGWLPQAEEARERTGVMIGSGIGGLPGITEGALTLHERGPRRLSPFFIPANLINLASGHVSIRLRVHRTQPCRSHGLLERGACDRRCGAADHAG